MTKRSISAEIISIPEKDVLTRMLVDTADLRTKLTAAVADGVALRAAIVAITAKLDLDAGVTDVNYAALTNPAALTATAPATATVFA